MIEQELANVASQRLFATLLTLVKVTRAIRPFAYPTKPIGPVYDEATARRLAGERGWAVAPLDILEVSVISYLVEHDVVVICTGGDGVPVIARDDGDMIGVEAVIDKDLASSLLARQLRADMLLMLTDVDGVYVGYGTPDDLRASQSRGNRIVRARFPGRLDGP